MIVLVQRNILFVEVKEQLIKRGPTSKAMRQDRRKHCGNTGTTIAAPLSN